MARKLKANFAALMLENRRVRLVRLVMKTFVDSILLGPLGSIHSVVILSASQISLLTFKQKKATETKRKCI